MKGFWIWLKSHYPLLVVAGTFLWSAGAIVSYRKQAVRPGVTQVLRIGHWQLEAGVRDAFRLLIADYCRLHPDVLIVQDAIPEGTYGQWMTTQLMGGTAPDIIEVGMGVPANVLLGFYNRYFVPLTSYVNQANPYNKGTELEAEAWRKTYKDGMRNGYIEELQEYMQVPLSQFGVRIFYNKTLLKKLTGLTEPPPDFRAFMAACDTIRSQKDERGKSYVPITASANHVMHWDNYMSSPLTFGAVRLVDFNRDGLVGADELFVGMKTGRVDFHYPPFEARFRMLRHLTDQFQPGFTGLGRDEAVFLFAQQRAVFITTGTWDAGTLKEQARDVFELGIMDFPFPTGNDPEFGSIVEGRRYEKPASSFTFAITRTSRYPEVALDFLQFISSRANNEKMNGIIGWIPAITGTRMSPLMSAFEPHLEGVYGAMPAMLGGETIIKWQQIFALFQIGQIDYEEMIRQYQPFYLEKGGEELEELLRNKTRGLIRDEQFLAGYRWRTLPVPERERNSREIKLRQLTESRLISRDLGVSLLRNRLTAANDSAEPAPYAFSPSVIAKVRARVTADAKEGARP